MTKAALGPQAKRKLSNEKIGRQGGSLPTIEWPPHVMKSIRRSITSSASVTRVGGTAGAINSCARSFSASTRL